MSIVLQLSREEISSWNHSITHSWNKHPTMGYLTSILWTIWRGSRILYLLFKSKESLRTIYFASSSSTHLLERFHIGLSSYHQDLSHPGPTSRMHFYAIYLMKRVLKTWGARLPHSLRSPQSPSEAPGSDSILIRGTVHTMDQWGAAAQHFLRRHHSAVSHWCRRRQIPNIDRRT